MAAALLPVLVASVVGLLPFTVFSTFLVAIAADVGGGVAAVGGLRGLGGLAALAVGIGVAPLVARLPRTLAGTGLLVLAAAAMVGALGGYLTLAAFCVVTGAATAVLNPALTATAANRYGTEAGSGRAATLVTATQSLAAVLAAPLLAVPTSVWGWDGTLVAVAGVAVALSALFFLRRRRDEVPSGMGAWTAVGYLASFRALWSVPGAFALLAVAFLRTAAFMGYLAYLAAYYGDSFQLEPAVFTLVWTASGASFFAGNLVVGRVVNGAAAKASAERILVVGLVTATLAMLAVHHAPTLAVAVAATVVLGASHAAVAACVVTLLVRRCGSLRGAALSLSGAGMSLGVFAGAGIGGAGLAVGGYTGLALALGGLTALAVPAALRVRCPVTTT